MDRATRRARRAEKVDDYKRVILAEILKWVDAETIVKKAAEDPEAWKKEFAEVCGTAYLKQSTRRPQERQLIREAYESVLAGILPAEAS